MTARKFYELVALYVMNKRAYSRMCGTMGPPTYNDFVKMQNYVANGKYFFKEIENEVVRVNKIIYEREMY